MSTFKDAPIQWVIRRLACDCGGEFEHKFTVKYAEAPYVHVCNQCSGVENMGDIYPKTVWEETK